MHVAVLLECRQVIQQWRSLETPFALRFRNRRHRIDGDPVVEPVGLRFLRDILHMAELPEIVPFFEGHGELPVIGRHELPVFLETGTNHGECRGLHPSERLVERAGGYRKCLARVDAHQPVRLCPAVGGMVEAVVFRSLFQFGEPFADGFVRERGDPEPAERFRVPQVGIDVPEYKFAFATRIRRHNNGAAPAEHGIDGAELFGGHRVGSHTAVGLALPDDELERVGQEGQVVARCTRVTVCARKGELYQMSQRPCDRVAVTFHIPVFRFRRARDSCYLPAYTRFFCYNCYHK